MGESQEQIEVHACLEFQNYVKLASPSVYLSLLLHACAVCALLHALFPLFVNGRGEDAFDLKLEYILPLGG
jgi:hypothetical protein